VGITSDVFAVGLASALVASVLFNVGVALQAVEARSAPRSLALRVSLLERLLRRPVWLLGAALGLAGIAPQILAFSLAPFVVVQTTLVAGLFVLLVLGMRLLRERVGVPEVIGVAALTVGIALVSWGAPEHSEAHRGGMTVVAVVLSLAAIAAAPLVARGTRADVGMFLVVASGCGFAAGNIATKLMSDDVGLGHYPNAVAWTVVGLATGIAATITGMTAFQRCRATVVVPLSTAVQTFLPILVEPLFLQERWGSAEAAGTPILLGLAVAIVGTLLVSRARVVSELVAAPARSWSQADSKVEVHRAKERLRADP
jgi:drug/metabolite transporter (DMT)-like permease